MNIETLTSFQLLITAFFIASLILHLLQGGRLRRNKHQLAAMQANIQGLNNNLRAMFSASVGLDKRVARIEKKARMQSERQDKLELHEPNLQVYGQAARLVRKGADLDEVVNTCGLSRGEAELILYLNGEHNVTQATH